MHRWTFVDDNTKGLPIETSSAISLRSKESTVSIGKSRTWTFNVVVNEELMPNERIAITGNCESLGQWKPGHCVFMDQGKDDSNTWTVTVSIPEHDIVQYRYFVCAVVPSTENVLVRRWETHKLPRSIPASTKSSDENKPDLYVPYVDLFGDVKGEEKIDRGWLTSETVVQLKFFNAPFVWKQRVKKRLLYAKVTPVSIDINGGDQHNNNLVSLLEDSLSSDTHENGVESISFGFSEVTSITRDTHLQQQPQFGWPCGEDDLVIFHMTVSDADNTAFLVDLYAYSSKASEDETPYHLGYQYIMPNTFKHSEGTLDISITCAMKHRPMGMMHIGYLQIRPSKNLPNLSLEKTFQRYWNPKWTGLDVGHRGSGTSFKTSDAVIRENTIASLKNAIEHGADMVEFDVQLSKDLVPVIYHDFNVYVSLKAKSNIDNTFLELPMRDLSLEQLKKLKVYHTSEGNSGKERTFHNDELMESQPFPQLAEVFDAIDPCVGFNIEIKWSQKLETGKLEEDQLETIVDRNLYIDCILETVFRKSDKRRIVFSCFDPDICTMLRYKQNRFPVMFLTLGDSARYQKYKDPRCNSPEFAICNARIMELLGVVAHTEDLLRDPTHVDLAKNLGLVVFCWGDDNNSPETIRLLKQLGLHAIIYDKMEVRDVKEVEESVFLVGATESLSDLRFQESENERLYPREKVNEEAVLTRA